MTLSFTFAGPDGQVVSSAGGVIVVDVRDDHLRWSLEDAASALQPVTPTGPWWLGGKGMEDPASVFWAVLAVLPSWTHSGDTPPVPWMPEPDPWVVYSPPAAL